MKINREEVYNKCSGHCAYCGKEITIKQMQVDHIKPLYRNDFQGRIKLN
jgi:5-methylcytosine-specific restriction endonuclease McrA